MFYTIENEALTTVNCAIQPNPDVSGIGVRIAFYLQALCSIILGIGEIRNVTQSSPTDIVLTNLSLQVAGLSLLVAAYFDGTMDVPHTIIASHLAVMMSVCRSTSNGLRLSFLRSRRGLRTLVGIMVLNLLHRPIILWFNWNIWSVIRSLQLQGLCPRGAGRWVVFTVQEMNKLSATSTMPLAFSILDSVWEILRWIAEVGRWVYWRASQEAELTMACDVAIDPRIWVLTRHLRKNVTWNWLHKWVSYTAQVHKIIIFVYVCVTIERILAVNDFTSLEGVW